jgi:preprotein translocase subunit SecF
MSLVARLYRGETRFNFVGHRKRWYLASAIILLICILSFVIRGFNYGVEFAGGTQFRVPATSSSMTVDRVSNAFTRAGEPLNSPPQVVGSGGDRTIVVKLDKINPTDAQRVQNAVAKQLHVNPDDLNPQSFSSSWGHDVTVKALEGLVVFIIVVSIYISIRFQWRMAIGGIVALLHDLVVTAGIYSLIGFEVTPSTIVGLLTILGFSLYDTVVVYDKIAENTRNILAGSRSTFSDEANLAVNQTLMRSINTSLIALLPVAGLLFVGAGLLGVGTIKDLALILFVGLMTGAYSSLFLATPIVVDLTERAAPYRALTKRVLAKRADEARREQENRELVAAGLPPRPSGRRTGGPAPAPRPGVRPSRRRR